MSTLSPEKLNATSNSIPIDDEVDTTWHNPPSSPFLSHIDNDDRENIAPSIPSTPSKPLSSEDGVPQSAFKISPEKKIALRERISPVKMSPKKQALETTERPESAMDSRARQDSPSRSLCNTPTESTQRLRSAPQDGLPDANSTPFKPRPLSYGEPDLLEVENHKLKTDMRAIEERQTGGHGSLHYDHEDDITGIEDTEFNPDGPELTSLDVEDTCFSTFSEMPGIDMTRFAMLRQSPMKDGYTDQSTPRARTLASPSSVRRAERTPSPTPRRSRKDNDTTNLLLDFTAQLEAFSSSRRGSPPRNQTTSTKFASESNLTSFYQNQRSPAKGGSAHVPATPSQTRQLLNLLDFELPPPPTPRSMPTVTIRELESLKSNFQSQISSLTASLSGKEAQVESLVQAVSDAERRVGETQEALRDERSAREHAEGQMEDWKKKGEEVQRLLQDVQAELARNDAEREQLLARLADTERRAEEAESRSSDLETKLIEAESKNVDMTTLVNPEEDGRKVYSEIECQTAIAEKVNEVARDLHAAYKAKHEKKIKALKDNYQKKADERCKELRIQITRLERQVEEAEKKRDDTFSKVTPPEFAKANGSCNKCQADDTTTEPATSKPEDLKLLEVQKSEIEKLKAKLAGLESELESIRKSHGNLLRDLEAERIEKGELVAAAEQMLAMCGEKMGEMQQEELRKSHMASAPPQPPPTELTMRSTGFLAGGGPSAARPGSALGGGRPGSALGSERGSGSGVGKPSGLRAPGAGGFGYGGPGHTRNTSGSKSRLMSSIEKMGGASKGQE